MIITNDDNIQPIYSFKNKDKRNRFPKAEIIIAFEFAVFGVSSSTLKTNQELGQFTNISGKSKVKTSKAILIKNDDSILFKTNSAKAIANEVTKMSEVTQKDLNATERYFNDKLDNKFDELSRKMDSANDNINKLDKSISKILTDIEAVKTNAENIPIRAKAEKYDRFKEKYSAPIVTGIVVGVVLILFKILFHV